MSKELAVKTQLQIAALACEIQPGRSLTPTPLHLQIILRRDNARMPRHGETALMNTFNWGSGDASHPMERLFTMNHS